MSDDLKSEAMENAREARREADNSWHLDKRVPVALIVVLALQVVLTVAAGSRVLFQVENLMDRVEKLETTSEPLREQLVRIETVLQQISQTADRQREEIMMLRRSVQRIREDRRGDANSSTPAHNDWSLRPQ